MKGINDVIRVGEIAMISFGYQDDHQTEGPYKVLHEMTLREMVDAYKIAWRLDAKLREGADVDDKPDQQGITKWLIKARIIEVVPHCHLSLNMPSLEKELDP